VVTENAAGEGAGDSGETAGGLQAELDVLDSLVARGAHKATVTKAFEIARRWPDCARAWATMVTSLAREGEIDRAMTVAGHAIQNVSDRWPIWFGLGLALRRSKRLKEAEEAYRRAIRSDPTRVEPVTNLASLLIEVGRPGEARDIVVRGRQRSPSEGVLALTEGRARRALDETEAAMVCFRQAIALNPDLVQAYQNLAEIERTLGLSYQAETSYRRAMVLMPQNATAHNNAGILLFETGDLSGALAAFRTALALDPADAQLYVNLSVAFNVAGMQVESAALQERALYLAPTGLRAGITAPLSTRASNMADYFWFFGD
jgi:Flp pilus assembly protein TadD